MWGEHGRSGLPEARPDSHLQAEASDRLRISVAAVKILRRLPSDRAREKVLRGPGAPGSARGPVECGLRAKVQQARLAATRRTGGSGTAGNRWRSNSASWQICLKGFAVTSKWASWGPAWPRCWPAFREGQARVKRTALRAVSVTRGRAWSAKKRAALTGMVTRMAMVMRTATPVAAAGPRTQRCRWLCRAVDPAPVRPPPSTHTRWMCSRRRHRCSASYSRASRCWRRSWAICVTR
mmetsp:Transcript_26282/g.84586  ORF Transcript_26282/g.84586 Transcript_26282/m.84586 type:complete len:237 (+) Transcript_26282:270-980(+)